MLEALLNRQPKVLILTPQRPVRHGNGSRVRSYQVIRALSKRGQVHLIQLPRHDGAQVSDDVRPFVASLTENPHAPKPQRGNSSRKRRRFARHCLFQPWKVSTLDWLMEARRICLGRMEVEEVTEQYEPFQDRLRAATLLTEIDLAHRWLGIPSTDAIQARAIPELVLPLIEHSPAAHGVDIVWLEHTHLLPLVDTLVQHFPEALLVCNAHNVLSQLHDAHASIMTSSTARRWHQVEARACRKMEREGLIRMDQVFCCSELDQERILKLAPGAKVRVWPNGVDPEFFRSSRPPAEPPMLLLPGSLNYVPNSEGARWFVNEVLPRVHQEFPACRLRIAGRGAEQTCGQLTGDRVEALSEVPDMRPHFEQAQIVIVPLRAGSGTRLKILEAMSMERAVVSTSIGAEGLTSENDRQLLVADRAEDFAAAINRLLGDPALRSELGRTGREFIQGRYDWKHLSEQALAGDRAPVAGK